MQPLGTDRLLIRDFSLADAPFVLELLNEPAFLKFIGDKGVRDLAGAARYLREGPLTSYAQHGFGLRCVTLRNDGTPVGSCGLLQRDFLGHPDLGYAFLTRFHGRGYALEAASAVLDQVRTQSKSGTVHAITAVHNPASIRLLDKLGFAFVDFIHQPGYTGPSRLFVKHLTSSQPS